jgi:hypothetical protein
MGAAARFCLGEFTAARAYAEQTLGLDRELQAIPRSPAATFSVLRRSRYRIAIARTHLFLSQFYLGYLDQARAGREEALAVARLEPFSLAPVLLGYCLCIELEPTLLLQRCEEFEAHCAEYGFSGYGAEAIAFHGTALSALGRTEEGMALQMQGLPCSIRRSMRSESTSDTFSATTSETRRPAP